VATKRIQDASLEEISYFLSTTFEPRASGLSATKEIDMDGYAQLAKFLSDRTEFATKAAELANVMATAQVFHGLSHDGWASISLPGMER
jgi:hypothetical protein